jgi:hypothetical protein
MNRKDAVAWLLSLCAHLRLSQAKTLSELAFAASSMVRTGLADLGRCLAGTTRGAVKHCIKRVDRFLGNLRVEPSEAMRGLIAFLACPRKRLLVSMDWVDIRSFQCLVIAARIKGRALPLLWAVYRQGELFRSQNNLEYGLLRALRNVVPRSTQVVLLADRGFGRTEMARLCQELRFDYVIRIQPNVYVQHESFHGRLLDLPIARGQQKMLRQAFYRKQEPVTQNVAVLWQADEEEPWFLMTSLPRLGALKLSRIYGHRMTIEEYFRDAKSLRNGFALRLTMIRSPQRLARMLLILALAYLLLVLVGLYASRRFRSGQWSSSNRPNDCSLVLIGRTMKDRLQLPSLSILARRLRHEILEAKWG